MDDNTFTSRESGLTHLGTIHHVEEESELIGEDELGAHERREAMDSQPRQQIEHDQSDVAVAIGHRVVEGAERRRLVVLGKREVVGEPKFANRHLEGIVGALHAGGGGAKR